MKRTNIFLWTFLILSSVSASTRDRVERIPFVEDLISKMTVEEKAGQMTQLTLDVLTEGGDVFSSKEPANLDLEILRQTIVKYHIGSILNTANNRARTTEKWNEWISQIQAVATKETRLGIPIIFGIDAIHGVTYTAGSTLIPQQIGQGATFNRDLVRKGAEITAYETKASGITWNFSPVLGVGVDPRWPRQWETFGEDPYLISELGIEMIKGMEGDKNEIGAKTKLASCPKHFLGYSKPDSGKDRTPVSLSDLDMRERFLPPFEEAIKAGGHTVMINSGIINGIPVHANHNLLTEILKDELGFDGIAVTDWADIENLHKRDRVAPTNKEAIKLAINAGIDMAMVPYDVKFVTQLTELVNDGEISMERMNDAVRRILNVKYKCGLFTSPVPNYKDYPKFGSSEFESASYQTALESITLLKNSNNRLPLKKGTKILVTGPNGNSMRTLNGGWSYSWQGEKVDEFTEAYNTITESLQDRFGKSNVSYIPGVAYKKDAKYWEDEIVDLNAVVTAAKGVDVIVVAIGENTYTEKPGDLNDLSLSKNQIELVKQVAKANKPIVLVLNEGRPRVINEIEPLADAILQTYLPSNFGGDALADLLLGKENPSGKLPYTYPRFVNTLVVYNHKHCEESKTQDGVYDYGGGFAPQFEFGFGLSYTTFKYSDMQVSRKEFNGNQDINVSIKITNIGKREGKESVLLFSSDQYASIAPDVKRLRKFTKINLKKGESKVVNFTLNAKDLSFINADLDRVTEKGKFDLTIADQKVTINLNKTMKY